MRENKTKPNRFVHIITTPYRALCKARDFYVRSMLDCASANTVGLQGSSQAVSLPRSFSAASSRSYDDGDDFREFVRAASARSAGVRLDLDNLVKEERKARAAPPPRALPPRSISVAMGRIDEERASSYFAEDLKSNGNKFSGVGVNGDLKYPRSKSHAVVRTPLI